MAYRKTITALRNQESTHWDIADALVAEIRTGNSWDELARELEDQGLDYKVSTLKVYRKVASQIPAEQRVSGVSFAAHQAAATLRNTGQIRQALDLAARNNGGKVTRDTVLAEVRKINGRTSGQTSDAVAAWRALQNGASKIAALPTAELDALLMMDKGKYAGELGDLLSDISAVQVLLAESRTRTEKAIKAAEGKKAARAAKTESKPTPKAKATKADAPKVGKMGARRGL